MRAGRSIVEYPLLLLWPGDLGDLGGEGNSGFRNYSNIMRQGNVMVWWKYLNSCTSNRVSSYSSFNIWSAERLKDGNDASSVTYTFISSQSCRPVQRKGKALVNKNHVLLRSMMRHSLLADTFLLHSLWRRLTKLSFNKWWKLNNRYSVRSSSSSSKHRNRALYWVWSWCESLTVIPM